MFRVEFFNTFICFFCAGGSVKTSIPRQIVKPVYFRFVLMKTIHIAYVEYANLQKIGKHYQHILKKVIDAALKKFPERSTGTSDDYLKKFTTI